MIELTKIHPTFWKDHTSKLVKIVADLVKMKDFDEGVRSQACEIIMHLAEEVPAILRKISDVKTEFFPALVQMLTECETDMEVWAETFEEENLQRFSSVPSLIRLLREKKRRHLLVK